MITKIEKKKSLITELLPYFSQPVTHFFPLSQIRLNNCFGIMLKIDDGVEGNGKKYDATILLVFSVIRCLRSVREVAIVSQESLSV